MKITVLSKQVVKRYKPQGVSALIAINDLDEIDHKRNYVFRFRYKKCFFHFFDDTLEDEPLVWGLNTWVICNDPEKVAEKLFAIFVSTKTIEFTAQHLDCHQKKYAIDHLLEIIEQLIKEKEDL